MPVVSWWSQDLTSGEEWCIAKSGLCTQLQKAWTVPALVLSF